MNARSPHSDSLIRTALLCLFLAAATQAQDLRTWVQAGNRYYAAGQFNEALNQYAQALTIDPGSDTARFNQANAYYRLEDLSAAEEAYRGVAAESRDMDLVAKAKYNLGNTAYQRALKQEDGDLNKALEALRTAIAQWRSVLELQPDHASAARNIEIARLKIKDLLDRQKQQQQDPNQAQDPNQTQQQQQQQRQPSQNDQAAQDPNQQDPNQTSPQEQDRPDPNEVQDPNQSSPPPEEAAQDPNQDSRKRPQDMTAQAILDKEQRQKEQRQQGRRQRQRPVERNW